MNKKFDLKSVVIGFALGILMTIAVVWLLPKHPRQSPDTGIVQTLTSPQSSTLIVSAPTQDSGFLDTLRQNLPETITPLTSDHLANKLPMSYDFGSGQNKRIMQRIDNDTWHEVYPDGFFSVFKVLGHTTIGGIEGTIVVKVAGDISRTGTLNDGSLHAFIPDKGTTNMRHFYRNAGRGDTQWNLSGTMKNIE